MHKKISILLFLFVLFASSDLLAGNETRIGYLSNANFNIQSRVEKVWEEEMPRYFQGSYSVQIIDDYEHYLDQIDKKMDAFVQTAMEKNDLSYLIYIEELSHEQIVVQVWNREGKLNNKYMACPADVRYHLPDIALNAFISLVDTLGGDIYEKRMY